MSLDNKTQTLLKEDENAKRVLLLTRASLERALRDLDKNMEWLESAESAADKARVMNSILHHLSCNILPNLCLDSIADAQAAFARRID